MTQPTPAQIEAAWPAPTKEMLSDPSFDAIWQCIRTWDINVPGVYAGYCGATGNHVRAILGSLTTAEVEDRLPPAHHFNRGWDAAIERCAQTIEGRYFKHIKDAAAAIRALKGEP